MEERTRKNRKSAPALRQSLVVDAEMKRVGPDGER